MSAWTTVSDLATGAGTLVLAFATFASVRSANRSARVAEDSMLASMRPILMNTRHQDPAQKLSFIDDIWLLVPGGGAAVQVTDGVIYLGISLRNVGTGMGILHGWRIRAGTERPPQRPALADFRAQTRDLYISPADMGFWEGALRDPSEPVFAEVAAAARAEDSITIDLLYGDFQGGQRVITRLRIVRSPFVPREPGYRPGQSPAHGAADGRPAGFGAAAPADGALAAQPDGALATQADGAPAGVVYVDGAPLDGAPAGAPRAGAAPAGAPPAAHRLPESSDWIASAVRHWNVDRPDPR